MWAGILLWSTCYTHASEVVGVANKNNCKHHTCVIPTAPYNCSQALACSPEYGSYADSPTQVAQLFFDGDMASCKIFAVTVSNHLGISNCSTSDCLECAAATDDTIYLATADLPLAQILAAVQAARDAETTLTLPTASLTAANVPGGILPADLFSCRRIAAVLNQIVHSDECDEFLCSTTEQERYEDRSCNDLRGMTQQDCEIPFFYGGRAARPSDPAGAGWPTDQTFVKRGFVGQNQANIIDYIANQKPMPNIKFGWFTWTNLLDATFVPPDIGYDECELSEDCETPGSQQALTRWDEECFGNLKDAAQTSLTRYLPDASTGFYPRNSTEQATANLAQTLSEPGQAYNRVCKYSAEKLVRTCTKPLPGSDRGVKTYCGCSEASNTYVKEGLFDLCHNAVSGIDGQFGGKSCDLTDADRRRSAAPLKASTIVGRPAANGDN